MTPEAETTGGSVQRLAETQAKSPRRRRRPGATLRRCELIVVSKTFGAPEILPLLQAGHRVFGENRVQEAKGKWPELKAQFPDLKLHLIGPLQSNKAKEAVELFDAVHTIDRPKIARALAAEMQRQGRRLQLFIQVNTGEEPQKAGRRPRRAAGARRAVPRRAGARDRRADVHSAGRRGAGDPFRLPRQSSPPRTASRSSAWA